MSPPESVPVVDVSGYGIDISDDAATSFLKQGKAMAMAKEITQAMETYGAVLITGHGVSNHVISNLHDANRKFSLCSDEQKKKYAFDADTFHGWLGPNVEKFGDVILEYNQTFSTMGYPAETNYPWPDDMCPGYFQDFNRGYVDSAELGKRLMTLLGLGSGLKDVNYLRDTFIKKPYSMGARANYCRALEENESVDASVQRLVEHRDFSVATIVYQTQTAGLQVKSIKTGDWMSIPYSPNSVVFQVGYGLTYVSNGRFPASSHRVMFPENFNDRFKDRQSFAFFINAPFDDILTSLDADKPVDPISFRHFLSAHLEKYFNMENVGDKVK